jgi:hypothetical protein
LDLNRAVALATNALVAIMFVAFCAIGWLVLGDRDPPVTLEGRFVGWQGNVARVEWAGTRHRSCQGRARRFAQDGMNYVELAGREISGQETTGPVRATHHIEVPPWVGAPFTLRVAIEYECNPFQHLAPFDVHLPPIEIPARPR